MSKKRSFDMPIPIRDEDRQSLLRAEAAQLGKTLTLRSIPGSMEP